MKFLTASLIASLVSIASWGQAERIVDLKKLTSIIEKAGPNVMVVNFWATWCGPCIKELPHFEKLTANNTPGVQVILVSMDLELDPDPEKVYRFIERKKIQSQVFLLNEPDANSWINKISTEWSGALPATLVINQATGKRKFVEKGLSEEELNALITDVQ